MTQNGKASPFNLSSLDAAYDFLRTAASFDVSKLLSTMLLLCASAAYTFSAMPSTVNFYRSIIPPIEAVNKASVMQSSPTADAVRKTNEIINVSQVYAVPSLLFILEIVSIFLAVEFWRLIEENKFPYSIILLFFVCQSYPFISVVFQIAETHRSVQQEAQVASSTSKSVRSKNLHDDTVAFNGRLAGLESHLVDLLKLKNTPERQAGIGEIRRKIDDLEKERKEKETKRDSIDEQVVANSSERSSYSAITYWLDNLLSREMLIAYFLASIFPVMLLSLGYYRVKIANQ